MAGTGVGKFSSTAGSNTSNLTVNFAENMAPSNVNNAARELMGHIRDMYEQLGDGYFEFGDGDGEYTVARSDADTITITSSSDISSVYFAGRKIRITDGGANVVEGTIASSSHTSTTQTVNLTGISLASGTPTKVELGVDTAAFGGTIVLDDDGDTYIEAPTDDTIDIYVAGAKDFVITANTFTAESGSTIAAQALTATTIAASSTVTGTSFNAIPFYQGDTGSIYTHDVSGTDSTAQYNTAYGLTAMDAITTGDQNTSIGYGAGGANQTGAEQVNIGYQAGLVCTSSGNVLIGKDAGLSITSGEADIHIGVRAGDGYDTETHNLSIGVDALGGSVAGGEFNVAIGNFTLDALTSGDNNVAIGYQAGSTMNSGANNVLLGYQAGTVLTGSSNTFLGYKAGVASTSGLNNTVVGVEANGVGVMTGNSNVIMGADSAKNATSLASCVIIGASAVQTGVATGANNVYIGANAAKANTSGDGNVAIGKDAFISNTTGASNIAIGIDALDGCDAENNNLAIGQDALGAAIAGGEYNVAVGNATGFSVTSGDANVTIGYQAGASITTGLENVILGMVAGNSNSSGIGVNTLSGQRNIVIGPYMNTAASDTNHGIGLGYAFAVAANDFSFGKASNVVTNDFDADADWSRSSDVRLKRNIEDTTLGLNFINDLRPVKFQWKPSNEVPEIMTSEYNEKNQKNLDYISHGFIAQEVKEVIDKHGDQTFGGWHLDKNDNETQRIKKNMFIMPLIKAVQEMSAQVTTLQNEVNTLKGE